MKIKCGDSLTTEQQLFQVEEGGATPTSPLQLRVRECKFSDIRHIFEKYHYKGGHMGGGISFCLALTFQGNVVGGMVFGKTRHDGKYSNDGQKNVIEIRRMALLEEIPKNSESYFLAKAIWYCRKHTDIDEIISYSDQSVGHVGTIYKAANFKLIGKTSLSKHVFWKGVRYHPRSLTIDRPYSYEMRKAVETGEATIETGEPKLIFTYQIRRGAKTCKAEAKIKAPVAKQTLAPHFI